MFEQHLIASAFAEKAINERDFKACDALKTGAYLRM